MYYICMARILITGGRGFVGQHIVRRLERDNEIHTEAVDGYYDVVIHQMANNDTLCDNDSIIKTNFYDSMDIFNSALRGGCKNFVYASSTAVYGNQATPYVEGVTPVRPLNKYGRSKVMFDEFAMKFAEENDVKVVGLRYCNVFGPGELSKGRRASMISQMVERIHKKENIVLFYDGGQKRDWVYVEDVVKANVLAINYPGSGIYNVGGGMSITFNDLAKLIGEVMGVDVKVNYIKCPFYDKYQSHTECSIDKIRTDLGFSPSYTIREGIENLKWEWYRSA